MKKAVQEVKRGPGRPRLYKTEAERRAAYAARKKRYESKLKAQRVRVVSYLTVEHKKKLDVIRRREGLKSMAESVRWLIERG